MENELYTRAMDKNGRQGLKSRSRFLNSCVVRDFIITQNQWKVGEPDAQTYAPRLCNTQAMNSMKIVIPLHLISWKKTPNDAVTWQRQSQFTPKMKANAIPRLLSSLVWIDQQNQCSGMTSCMEFMCNSVTFYFMEKLISYISRKCILPNMIRTVTAPVIFGKIHFLLI